MRELYHFRMSLFSYLLDLLFPPRDTEALVRGANAESLGALMHPAFVERISPPAIALLPYRARLVRAVVVEAKYKGSPKAWELLGKTLADYLIEWGADEQSLASPSFVIVPIPLSSTRRRERGYNQAEEIAKAALSRLSGFPFSLETTLLVRTRDTTPQTTLGGRARRENMRSAFSARPLDPAPTYVVLDDVLTTGATLEAASAALIEAGAVSVVPLALAH